MKFTCNRESFLTAYQTAAAYAPSKSARPILANVKLDLSTDGKSGVLSATDTELGIRVEVDDLETSAVGSAILPAGRFGLVLRESNDDRLEIESDGGNLVVRGERSMIRMPAHNPDEFPSVAKDLEGNQFAMEAQQLRSMIRRTVFATDVESTRFALGGVLFEYENEIMTAVGTDGRRMAKVAVPVRSLVEGTAPPTIVPARALHLFERSLADEEGEITLSTTNNACLVKTAKHTIFTRLVEGRFPKWQSVMPEENKGQTAGMIVGPFYAALRQAAIVTDKESKGINFAFSAGAVVLSGNTADIGSSRIELPVGYDGPEITLCLDHKFFADFLRCLEPTDTFDFQFTSADMPALCATPDGYRYVVMPLAKE